MEGDKVGKNIRKKGRKIEWQKKKKKSLPLSLWGKYMNEWRRQWHPTPVLLPGKSHGQRSLVGCHPWGRTESDTTEVT